jgi:hypothetical protein
MRVFEVAASNIVRGLNGLMSKFVTDAPAIPNDSILSFNGSQSSKNTTEIIPVWLDTNSTLSTNFNVEIRVSDARHLLRYFMDWVENKRTLPSAKPAARQSREGRWSTAVQA